MTGDHAALDDQCLDGGPLIVAEHRTVAGQLNEYLLGASPVGHCSCSRVICSRLISRAMSISWSSWPPISFRWPARCNS